MNRNPYTPPHARLEHGSDRLPIRPKLVTAAIYLFWASVAIGVIAGMPNLIALRGLPGGAILVASLFIGVLMALFVGMWVKIANGRRWARTTLVTLMMLGAIPGIKALLIAWAGSKSEGLLTSAQFALQAASVFLLFMPSADDWFCRPGIRAPESAGDGREAI